MAFLVVRMKWILAGIFFSLIPIWRDDMSDQALNLWQYIDMAAAREHIPAEEARGNFERNN